MAFATMASGSPRRARRRAAAVRTAIFRCAIGAGFKSLAGAGFGVEHGLDDFRGRGLRCAERPLAAQEFVEQDAKGVDIVGNGGWLAAENLGLEYCGVR